MTSDGEREKVPPPEGSIADLYREVLPALDFEAEQTKWDVALTVAPEQVHNVLARSLRDERLSMDLLRNLTAVDWQEKGLEVVYHLYSIRHRHSVTIKTRLPSQSPALRSATDLYHSADWAERECREMFGIEFDGHPNPRNLLLDEDLDIHPLRKDHPLAPIELLQGVDVEYFRKEHPAARPPAGAKGEAAAKEAAAAKPAKKPEAEMTPEELEERKAAQAERVQRGRELAAARRTEGGPSPMKDRASTGAATAAASAAPAAEAEPQAAPAQAGAAAAPRAPAAATPSPKKSTAEMTPEELEERKAAQAERVQRGRELAAAARAEKQRGGG